MRREIVKYDWNHSFLRGLISNGDRTCVSESQNYYNNHESEILKKSWVNCLLRSCLWIMSNFFLKYLRITSPAASAALLATSAKWVSWWGGEEEAMALSLSLEDDGEANLSGWSWRREVVLGIWEWRRWHCDSNISVQLRRKLRRPLNQFPYFFMDSDTGVENHWVEYTPPVNNYWLRKKNYLN